MRPGRSWTNFHVNIGIVSAEAVESSCAARRIDLSVALWFREGALRSAIFRAFTVLLTCILASSSLLLGSASATEDAACPGWAFCWWDGVDFTGRTSAHEGVASGSCLRDLNGLDIPLIHSALSNRPFYQRIWQGANCTGRNILIAPYGGNVDIGFYGNSLGGY